MLRVWVRPGTAPRTGFRDGRVHRLGLAGNVVALAAIVVICSSAQVLLTDPARQGGASLARTTSRQQAVDGRSNRLVLVVIDGLRAESAFDPQQMLSVRNAMPSSVAKRTSTAGVAPADLGKAGCRRSGTDQ